MALPRRGKKQDTALMMEINTTPLIDVMLVLLIMLIITIPMQLHTVELDLPVPTDSPPPSPKELRIVRIAIGPESLVRWNDKTVDLAELNERLLSASVQPDHPELQVRPDAYASYSTVVHVMAAIKRHHLTKVGLAGQEQFD
ncbi:MAG: biopolymer transporter ExbD [Pseudacidovorax sp.]|nr:biopolymer transporter ExbD [Pseudacidovorax sp.]